MSQPLLVGLSPWLVFLVASRSGGLGLRTAALVALGASATIAAVSWRRSSLRGLELVAVGTFTALTVLGAALPGDWLRHVSPYGRAISAFCMAAAALGSLLGSPLSERFTVDRVPVRQAESPAFRRANRVLTAGWGAAATLAGISFVLAVLIGGRLSATVFNWFVPLVLVWVCARFASSRWFGEFADDLSGAGQLSAGLIGEPDGPAGDAQGDDRAEGARLRVLPPA